MVVNIKVTYLTKRYSFKSNIYCLDKTCASCSVSLFSNYKGKLESFISWKLDSKKIEFSKKFVFKLHNF